MAEHIVAFGRTNTIAPAMVSPRRASSRKSSRILITSGSTRTEARIASRLRLRTFALIAFRPSGEMLTVASKRRLIIAWRPSRLMTSVPREPRDPFSVSEFKSQTSVLSTVCQGFKALGPFPRQFARLGLALDENPVHSHLRRPELPIRLASPASRRGLLIPFRGENVGWRLPDCYEAMGALWPIRRLRPSGEYRPFADGSANASNRPEARVQGRPFEWARRARKRS